MEKNSLKRNVFKVKPILKAEEQKYLSLLRRFNSVSNSLKGYGLKLYNEKDKIMWINKKARKDSKNINYYAFNNLDFTKLSQMLNELTEQEDRMKAKGIDLGGYKSFNRNAWLDLSKESNKIEGIFDDFGIDLMDFRTRLRGEIALDPSTKNFEKFDYYCKLREQYNKITENNDSYIIQGKKKTHILNMDTIRHFIAFKYVYKCGKQDKDFQPTAQDFSGMISNVHSLLSGQDFVGNRQIQVYVANAPWVPVRPDKISDRLDALANWFVEEQTLHPIEKAAMFHAEFIRIHPFIDGNGRTSRIMTNYLLIKNEIPCISIRYKNTEEYFKALNKAIETHDLDDLVGIFYREVENSCHQIKECFDYLEKEHDKKDFAKENLK